MLVFVLCDYLLPINFVIILCSYIVGLWLINSEKYCVSLQHKQMIDVFVCSMFKEITNKSPLIYSECITIMPSCMFICYHAQLQPLSC